MKSKKQLKQDAKKSLIHIKANLRELQLAHLVTLSLGIIIWVIKVVLLDQALDCSLYFDDIMDSLEDNHLFENQTTVMIHHPSVSLDYANQLEEEHIENLVNRQCLTVLNETMLNGTDLDPIQYGDAIPNGEVSQSVYACTECVPLPYEGILPPNALDWYSPLHWWDFASITVALAVQLRLKTIDDSKMGGSFGPLVVDEKDIAITAAHLMTILTSIFFYCIEVAISSMWISLHHEHDNFDTLHVSYYTVYERNYKLTIWNTVWLACMLPMFCIAYQIKKQIQKYEQNQFLTEL